MSNEVFPDMNREGSHACQIEGPSKNSSANTDWSCAPERCIVGCEMRRLLQQKSTASSDAAPREDSDILAGTMAKCFHMIPWAVTVDTSTSESM
jgi:hypothetical protein